MSIELKKRGRPSKKAIEEVLAEKTPTATPRPTSAKKVTKATPTSTTASKSSGNGKKSVGKELDSRSTVSVPKKSLDSKATQKKTSGEQPPPVVLQTVAIEESKILKELSESKKKLILKEQAPKPSIAKKAAELIPPITKSPLEAAHLLPTNTLAMGLPIPSSQSTTHTINMHPNHILPWLPNPSMLPQSAHLSTTTRLAMPKNKLNFKEANKFAVSSSLPSGQAKAVEPKVEMMRPGKMPKKYKPAARRVTAIIVALPIVIVSSWMLYERLVLGAEQKKVPRLPPAPPADAE